jgi:hypothetical protein
MTIKCLALCLPHRVVWVLFVLMVLGLELKALCLLGQMPYSLSCTSSLRGLLFFVFVFVLQYWDLNSGPTP